MRVQKAALAPAENLQQLMEGSQWQMRKRKKAAPAAARPAPAHAITAGAGPHAGVDDCMATGVAAPAAQPAAAAAPAQLATPMPGMASVMTLLAGHGSDMTHRASLRSACVCACGKSMLMCST